MDITMSLGLPSEALSIPVIRRVLGDALHTLGVEDSCVGDVQVAVAEACTNVLNHACPADEYEVVACVDGRSCVLQIIDHGVGFDAGEADGPGPEEDPAEAEHGRGIDLMRALVDDVSFERHAEHGTVVSLHKELTWRGDAPLSATTIRRPGRVGACA